MLLFCKKYFFKRLLLPLAISLSTCCVIFAQTATTFYVSPKGNDSNNGTMSAPFGTLEKAQEAIRSITGKMNNDITVLLMDGNYQLTKPLIFNNNDGGSNKFSITYKALNRGKCTITGGKFITDWKLYDKSNNIWQSTSPVDDVRQLYVNSRRMNRAKTPNLNGVLHYDENTKEPDGVSISSNLINIPEDSKNTELSMAYKYRFIQLPVTSIKESNGQTIILLKQPYLSITVKNVIKQTLSKGSSDNTKASGINDFVLENSVQFIKQPGDWSFDQTKHIIYYKPDNGVSPSSEKIVIPVLEDLIAIKGNSVANKIVGLNFEDINFSYSSWSWPTERGFITRQAECLFKNVSDPEIIPNSGEGYNMVPAAIKIDNAEAIKFKNNSFEHLGAVAVGLYNGVSNSTINGNFFVDISDAAVTVGKWSHVFLSHGEESCKNDTLSNNVIKNIGVEYWSAPAITAFYVEGLVITHNHLSDLPYSGISLGWGWNKNTSSTTCKNNEVSYNYISNYLLKCMDGGGVYTLGQQPNSKIIGNYLVGQNNEYAAIYNDAGSAGFEVSDNVIEKAKCSAWAFTNIGGNNNIYQNNYTTNQGFWNRGKVVVSMAAANGLKIKRNQVLAEPSVVVQKTNVYSETNRPTKAKTIIESAGLLPEYKTKVDVSQ